MWQKIPKTDFRKRQTGNTVKTGPQIKKMTVGFGISDQKSGKYDTFLGVPKFLITSVKGSKAIAFAPFDDR